jgi:hypothetical protein
MIEVEEFLCSATEEHQSNRCIVRLRTTMWSDKKGAYFKKSLTFLRKQCKGFNVLEEDISAAGVELILNSITNLHDCADGIYEFVVCNESRDWETGYVDEWEYDLRKVNNAPEL